MKNTTVCTVYLYSAFQRILNACVSKLLVAVSLAGIHYVNGYNSHYFQRWEKIRSLDVLQFPLNGQRPKMGLIYSRDPSIARVRDRRVKYRYIGTTR